MKVYYDKDGDLALLKGKNIVIVGYGSQGHAHALNLKDSGLNVTVALRAGSSSAAKAKKAGLATAEITTAVKGADIVMLLLPDEDIAAVYAQSVEPYIKKNATLGFAHGFNIHYAQVRPRSDLDVIMLRLKHQVTRYVPPINKVVVCHI